MAASGPFASRPARARARARPARPAFPALITPRATFGGGEGGDMAMVLLVVLGLALLATENGSRADSRILTSIVDVGSKTRLTCTLNDSDTEISGHRWVKGDRVLHEDSQTSRTMEYEVDMDERVGQYSCIFLPESAGRTYVDVRGPPKIRAAKKSEHATEGETAVLICKSTSFPPVTDWLWYKMTDTGPKVLANNSQNFVVSSDTKTELHIQNLDLQDDPGTYVCNGTNAEDTAQAVITLRVRHRLAALWPFLGIVAEVLVLVTVILIYEKRRKPDEVLDDEDTGSAPLKSSSHHVNDKDKNVRQRNAN